MHPPTPLRVLLVTSCEVDQVIVRRLLTELRSEYDLTWAESFAEGLRGLQHQDHDVALVDERIGSSSGIDLLPLARPRLPVLMLSDGPGDRATDEEAIELGAAGWIDKSRLDARELERRMRLALLRGRSVQELRERHDELMGLHRLTALVVEGADVPHLYPCAAEELALATGFPIVCIESHDPARESLTCVGTHGLSDQVRGRTWPVLESPVAEAILEARVLIETGPSAVPMHLHGSRLGTWIALPLRAGGRVLGVVTLASTKALPVDSTQIHLATGLVDHLARLCERLGQALTQQQVAPPRTEPLEGAVQDSGEILRPLEEIGPAVASLRGELAQRGVLVRLRDLGGARWVAGGTNMRIRHHGRLLLGSLLRSLGPSRAEVRVMPEDPHDQDLVLDLTIESLGTDPRHDGKAIGLARLSVLARMAQRLGVKFVVGSSGLQALRARLEFPLVRPVHEPCTRSLQRPRRQTPAGTTTRPRGRD